MYLTKSKAAVARALISRRSPVRMRALGWALLGLLLAQGCKTKSIIDNPDEHGKLNEISANLEKAFGSRPLPGADEPVGFAERLRNWVDFRECAVKTYVARHTATAKAREKGFERPTPHASIGDETVEECAVQAAVAKERRSYCERLEVDFRRADGLPPLSAMRCWDTRARVLGLPQECPLQWLPSGAVGRNAECLAMALRDDSLCPFAPSEERCRALVMGDVDLCHLAPPDCRAAVAYWEGLVPKSTNPRTFDHADVQLAPPPVTINDDKAAPSAGLKLHLTYLGSQQGSARFQVQAPLDALGISWPSPTAPMPPGLPPEDRRWGIKINDVIPPALAAKAAEISFVGDEVSLRLVFQPAGTSAATLPLRPPSPTAPATLVLVLTNAKGERRVCQPSDETKGSLSFEAKGTSAGSFVNGKIEAETFPCDDGSTAKLQGAFRVAITNVR